MAFSQAMDEIFLVTCEILPESDQEKSVFVVTQYGDEDEFLQGVLAGDIGDDQTVSVVSAVLLAIAERAAKRSWVPLTLSWRQYLRMGLSAGSADLLAGMDLREVDLHDVLLQTPTPFAVMTGPEHRMSFLNQPYVTLLRRTDRSEMIGKTIQDALPELSGQAFFPLLDKVYRDGKPYVGQSVPGTLRNARTNEMEEHYFDFVYYPLRDSEGVVYGILAQASDVTEQVLAEQVNYVRENLLYKQWAELDAIYKNSPLAMCLLDANDYRIIRLNDMQAELLGGRADDFIGKSVPDLVPQLESLRELYGRVANGEAIHNKEIRVELPLGAGVIRTWLVTCSPLFEENGEVGAIASIGVEITDRVGLATNTAVSSTVRLLRAEVRKEWGSRITQVIKTKIAGPLVMFALTFGAWLLYGARINHVHAVSGPWSQIIREVPSVPRYRTLYTGLSDCSDEESGTPGDRLCWISLKR